MGFLGLSLTFVSITLILNGIGRKVGFDGKSAAFFNVFTGVLLFVANTISLTSAETTLHYQNAASGFLFSVTYMLLAANNLFSLDMRIYGIFSGLAALYALIMAVNVLALPVLAALWFAWCLLWLSGFLEIICGLKLAKISPYFLVAEGIFAAGIPGVCMLLGIL